MLAPLIMTQIFVLAGTAMLVCAILIWRRHQKDRKRRRCHITGIVTKNVRRRIEMGTKRRPAAWFPVVRYTCLDGRQITAQSRYGTGAVQYDTDSVIDIWYDPENPEDFHLDNHNAFVVGPVAVFSVLSVLFAAFGLFFGYLVLTGAVS